MADDASKQSIENGTLDGKASTIVNSSSSIGDREYPTEHEMSTLPRVSGKVRWTAYTIAIVEMCERFSYHGTTAVCEYFF